MAKQEEIKQESKGGPQGMPEIAVDPGGDPTPPAPTSSAPSPDDIPHFQLSPEEQYSPKKVQREDEIDSTPFSPVAAGEGRTKPKEGPEQFVPPDAKAHNPGDRPFFQAEVEMDKLKEVKDKKKPDPAASKTEAKSEPGEFLKTRKVGRHQSKEDSSFVPPPGSKPGEFLIVEPFSPGEELAKPSIPKPVALERVEAVGTSGSRIKSSLGVVLPLSNETAGGPEEKEAQGILDFVISTGSDAIQKIPELEQTVLPHGNDLRFERGSYTPVA